MASKEIRLSAVLFLVALLAIAAGCSKSRISTTGSEARSAPTHSPIATAKGNKSTITQTDEEKVQGAWVTVSLVRDGIQTPEGKLAQMRMEFKGAKIVPQGGEETSFRLDPGKNPKQVDILDGSRTVRGIYAFDGEQLKMCMRIKGNGYPSEFTGEQDHTLMVLRRLGPSDLPLAQPKRNPDEDVAIAAIKKAGGRITTDENKPTHPVTSVHFSGGTVNEEVLASLGKLPDLERLELQRAQGITSAALEKLGALKGLRILSLESVPLDKVSLAKLASVPHLQSLSLRRSQVTNDHLAELGALPGLLRLDISQTKVTDAGLHNLKGLKRLQELRLEFNEITDDGLASLNHLANLRYLDLGFTQVAGNGLGSLKGLKNLDRLNLTGSRVTDSGLEPVRHMTHLRELVLGGTKISDEGIDHIKGLSKLQTLGLSQTLVTDKALIAIGGLSELKELYLTSDKITDKGLEAIKAFSKLQSLSVGGTEISDAGLAHLKGLTGLRTLGLERTKISDAGLTHMKELPNLTTVSLFGTGVTAEGVKLLRKSLPGLFVTR